ncbi:RraA family protein [Paenarthrobacter sp. AMU7]|uniref:Putative 4-hydroxy-4-methyl-2-oxoglutarate aldolase n=1 Tax=Paenarthrobacter sp. AMU7 TaxID=3162492 RepID=A0AB39YNM6_9MICC
MMELSTNLQERLTKVSVSTFGHFLEDGFLDPGIRRLAGSGTVVGPARTVRIDGHDALAMNRAILGLRAGEFLVVSMSGDHRHAPLGAITAAALVARGAVGVVVDGVVTDIADLRSAGLSVYARGTSCLTTKRTKGSSSEFDSTVECGGVDIAPNDLIMASDDGIAGLNPVAAESVLGLVEASDAAEPTLLRRIRAGEPLESLLAKAPTL